ncbi:MAG: winged helix-turn-helix transcriptional regulator [Ruminococcus sp.]|nr:winged helix-turn-helix transcriptional regulator [Ruminococcus sp.]
MPINKNRIDYFELKSKLKFVNRPLFEFCGAYVNYLDSFYGLNKNDPKINLLCSKQGLYNEVMNAFESELSPYVKSEIEAFSFCNILQSVLKAFLFDYKSINSFDALLKKYDNYKIEGLFDFIGGCFINEHLQSNCEDWPSSDLKAMALYIEKSDGIDADAKRKVLDLYAYPEEAKMRIRYIIVSMYQVFKRFESDTIEQAKKQLKRYMNLMEIDYDYFCRILKFDDLAEVISNNEQIDLYISYMFTVSYFCKDYSDGTVLLVNGFLCDEYRAAKLEQHSVENFLSIIGDKQCREILMYYVERPYYLLELSRELSIAPQKLRMYNKRFMDAALIDFEHTGGRRYYKLNKEEFDKQFEMCKRLFR